VKLQKTILTEAMDLTKTEQWANQCPRCFGPREGEIKVSEAEPDIIMALDGNFQQRHYAYASKDNPPEDRYPQAFIPPSKIAADAVTFTATDSAAQGIDVSQPPFKIIIIIYTKLKLAINSLHAPTHIKLPTIPKTKPLGRSVTIMGFLQVLVVMTSPYLSSTYIKPERSKPLILT
jgi:hypothetical protein